MCTVFEYSNMHVLNIFECTCTAHIRMCAHVMHVFECELIEYVRSKEIKSNVYIILHHIMLTLH